jgi:hypothetical protein
MYDYSDIPEGLSTSEQAEELFWAYQHAKGRFRKFMRKPVRRVRRFLKRRGKGKGKHPGYYLTNLKDQEIENMFFGKGHRKGKGKRSSGKGKGRRQNPKGSDGQIMKCRVCGSIEHFQRECPRNKGGGAPRPNAPPAGNPGNAHFFMNPRPTVDDLDRVDGVTIFEIVGNQEVPLLPRANTPVMTTFASYSMNMENSRLDRNPGFYGMSCFMFNMYQTDPASIPVDPWMNYLGGQSSEQAPVFTREQYDEHMRVMHNLSNPLLPVSRNVPEPQMMQGIEEDRPQEHRLSPGVPLWATFENASRARGNFSWNPGPRDRLEVPKLYRSEYGDVEPMHERIVYNFYKRRTPEQFAVEIKDLYKNSDSRMDAHQWRLIEQSKLIQDELKDKREHTKQLAKRTARAKLLAES